MYVTQQKEIARLEEAIRRFKDWAHRVVDERHITRARNMQRRIDAMDKVERPVFERRKMALALRSGMRGGERVLELEGADVAFGEEPVLLDVDLTIMRGERVGVVGANGAGKSVLLGLATGRLTATSGRRWTGPTIRFGYLSQTAAELVRDHLPDDAALVEIGPRQHKTPRTQRVDGRGLIWIAAGWHRHGLEKCVLGLDARNLVRIGCDESRATGACR